MKKLVVLLALAAVIAALSTQTPARPPNCAEEVAQKREHLAKVVAELSAEPVGNLTAAQRERRAEALAHLKEYARRGEFPHNTDDPGFAIPTFIDAYGTRCALAYAIDESGEGGIVRDLAARDNHAFVAHLQDEPRLAEWLARNGLTLDDAAFIQFPGFDGGGEAPPGQGLPGREEEEEPEEEEPAPEPPADDEPAMPDAAAPPPQTPSGATGPARRARGSADRGDWRIFWSVNRDAYISLRKRYHDGTPLSGTPFGPTSRARRPSAAVLRGEVMPLLEGIGKGDGEVSGNAIMAAAIGVKDPADAPSILLSARAYLSKPGNKYREFLLLGVGRTRHESATELLVRIARDRREGREAVGRRNAIPDRMRAFAALALGLTGDGNAVAPLRELLENLDGRHEDLRVAAVTSIGLLLPKAKQGEREASVRLLTSELKRERWPRRALTALPAALLRSGDEDARRELLRRVARFRGDREMRASAALAFGTFGAELDEEVVDALMAAARRDPDLQTRRHAAIAIGELALRDGSKDVPEKMRRSLRRFYLGTLEGHFKQPGALEWHYLSAGMFARRFPADAERVLQRLEKEAVSGRKRDERAAAVLALGLSGSPAARRPLRGLFESAKDVRLRGSAAEALGMLGDRASRDRLLELATTAPSDDLRYQAALALGYLADAKVVPQLVEALEKARSEQTRAALTRVLGQIGDERAIPGLSRIAADAGKPPAVRQRALSALGLLARDADESWTLPLRRGVNIAQATPSLLPVLFIF